MLLLLRLLLLTSHTRRPADASFDPSLYAAGDTPAASPKSLPRFSFFFGHAGRKKEKEKEGEVNAFEQAKDKRERRKKRKLFPSLFFFHSNGQLRAIAAPRLPPPPPTEVEVVFSDNIINGSSFPPVTKKEEGELLSVDSPFLDRSGDE